MTTILHKKKACILPLLLICLLLTACSSQALENARIAAENKNWARAIEIIEEIPDQEMEGVPELRNECYFQFGCHELFISLNAHSAADAFAHCNEHKEADDYYTIASCISANDLYGALDAISQILQQNTSLHNADEWLRVLQHTISSDLFQEMTLEERFKLEKVLQSACPSYAVSLQSAVREIAEACKTAEYKPIPRISNFDSYPLKNGIPEQACINAGDGTKLLIIRVERPPNNKWHYSIAFDLMRQLPPECQPSTLEEATNILVLTNHYEYCGSYMMTTSAYQLGIELELLAWNPLYGTRELMSRHIPIAHVDTIWGKEPPGAISFEGNRPKYYVAEPPDIRSGISHIFANYLG